MPEILEGQYKVDRVMRVMNGFAWVRWASYNFLGDTLEPLEHIEPRSKLTSFLKGKQVTVDLAAPPEYLSKHLISMATSRKISERGPTYRKESTVERLAIPEIGLGVLYLVKPAGVKLEVLPTSSGKSTSITIWDMDAIADVVAIHLYKPEEGEFSLRMRCSHYMAPFVRHRGRARRHARACNKLVSRKYTAFPDHEYGLSATISARSEHTAMGKPREGRRSK